MDETFTLPGDNRPIQLDHSGITLIAPGLSGRGEWNSARPAGVTRAFTGETGALD
ncbi:MAG: hypothetical protein HY023_05080, partial [Chloroflexi bacterium]|nr:hypothetical protein [Chloroflexota bacterium]